MSKIPNLSGMHITYKLDGHTPVQCDDPVEWAEWMIDSWQDRRVARTTVGEKYVSTVFLGSSLDGSGQNLFETAVFGPQGIIETWKSNTWEEAESVHAGIVDILQHMSGENQERDK